MDTLNHHHLYLFWNLCHHQSFSKTAKILKISQSAVTIQIQKLEASIKKILIDRSERKKFKLTPDGEMVYRYANEIFNWSLQLKNWLEHEETNQKRRIKIGAVSGISRNLIYNFITPLLDKDYSELEIELLTGEYLSLISELESQRLDIVLSSSYLKPKNPDSIQYKVLFTSPLVIVTSNRKDIGSKPLDSYEFILPGFVFDSRIEFDEWVHKQKLNLRVKGQMDDIAMLRVFAIRSPQYAVVLPEIGVITDIENKKIKVIKRLKSIEQKFYAIFRNETESQKQLSQLVSIIKKKN